MATVIGMRSECHPARQPKPLPGGHRVGYEFVEVVWLDAVTHGGWSDPEEKTLPAEIRTRGWLIADEPEYVTLAMGIDTANNAEVGNIWTVPRGMIKEIKQVGS